MSPPPPQSSFNKTLRKYSNPVIAQKRANQYLGKSAVLYPATRKHKKYSVFDKKHNQWVSFGQLGYEDYTKHKDKTRRRNYLTRATHIKGDWKRNKYSPNNLSIRILW